MNQKPSKENILAKLKKSSQMAYRATVYKIGLLHSLCKMKFMLLSQINCITTKKRVEKRRVQVTGYWILGTGYWVFAIWYWVAAQFLKSGYLIAT